MLMLIFFYMTYDSPFLYSFLNIKSLANQKAVISPANIQEPKTKRTLFGPAGLTGTVVLRKVVKAGVFSCT